jgi:hypothetical protein
MGAAIAMDNGAGPVNVFDRAVCLSIKLRRLGTTRKVQTGAIQTDADADMIHVAKDILKCPELDAIRSLHGEVRQYIAARAVPAEALFRAGVYFLAKSEVVETVRWLKDRRTVCEGLIEKFGAVYEQRAREAMARLGSLQSQRDYPSWRRVLGTFGFDWQFVTFGTPTELGSISETIFDEEIEKSRASIVAATDEIQACLRAGFLEVVEHMSERLTPSADGTAKIFRDSLVENVREFIATFKSRNIVDDSALDALVARARRVMDGVDPNALRDGAGVREKVRAEFGAIKATLDTMLVDD